MARLIDADALKKAVNGRSTHWLNDWSTLGVLAVIDEQPTISAVPVTEIEKAIERYKGYAKKHSENGNFTMTSVFAAAAAALMELMKENADADS